MFLAEINRLRNFTKFVIQEWGLEQVEGGLLDELYDTDNDHLKELTVHVLSLLAKEQCDNVCLWWKNLGNELPDLYFGGEDE